MSSTNSPLLATAHHVVRDAAPAAGLSDEVVAELLEPEETTTVDLSVDGLDATVRGWRVRHSSARGPAKGGIRFTPTVTEDDIIGLATLMTLKTAVTNLPMGGGKGGLAVPAGIDATTTSALGYAYGEALAGALGGALDVAAPDIGTNPQTMLDIIRGWASANGVDPDSPEARSVVTGKPMDHGGLALRTGATARGLRIAIRHLATHHDLPDEPRVAIQGFGSVGGSLASILDDNGWRVVALSDSSGTIADDRGLDLSSVQAAKKSDGTVAAGPGTAGASDDIFDTECDVLVLAAQEAAVDADVAHRLRASAIVEGSNAPCTSDGDRVLDERNITVVPDIVANAGGVTGSWFELADSLGTPFEEAGQRFAETLESANERMWSLAAERSLRPRTAATVLALRALLDR